MRLDQLPPFDIEFHRGAKVIATVMSVVPGDYQEPGCDVLPVQTLFSHGCVSHFRWAKPCMISRWTSSEPPKGTTLYGCLGRRGLWRTAASLICAATQTRRLLWGNQVRVELSARGVILKNVWETMFLLVTDFLAPSATSEQISYIMTSAAPSSGICESTFYVDVSGQYYYLRLESERRNWSWTMVDAGMRFQSGSTAREAERERPSCKPPPSAGNWESSFLGEIQAARIWLRNSWQRISRCRCQIHSAIPLTPRAVLCDVNVLGWQSSWPDTALSMDGNQAPFFVHYKITVNKSLSHN